MSLATIVDAKKVTTYDHGQKENGFLIELYKDGDKTTAYLTAATPGAFKGYHCTGCALHDTSA